MLPADATARALVEMRNSEIPFLHLAHPHPVAWSIILDPIARELGLARMTFDAWLCALEKSGEGLSAEDEVQATRENPALKLLSFFAQGTGDRGSTGAFGIQALDVTNARKASRTLNDLPPLAEGDVMNWLSYWRRIGFL